MPLATGSDSVQVRHALTFKLLPLALQSRWHCFNFEVQLDVLHLQVYHLANKAIPCADPTTGLTVKPASTNGIKLESFIFDVFPQVCNNSLMIILFVVQSSLTSTPVVTVRLTRLVHVQPNINCVAFSPTGLQAEAMAVLQIVRADEFSPVKNAPGAVDDSPITARAMTLAAQRQWLVAAGATIEGDIDVEVSPLVSYSGEGLASLAGRSFTVPTLIAGSDEDVSAAIPGTAIVQL